MLVKAASERYVETYLTLMKALAAGGRTPGLTLPSPETLRQFFAQTTPEYWQQLPPDEAQSQLRQWKQVQ